MIKDICEKKVWKLEVFEKQKLPAKLFNFYEYYSYRIFGWDYECHDVELYKTPSEFKEIK